MKLRVRREFPDRPPPVEGEEYEALKNARKYHDDQASIYAIVKMMGLENLDGPFRRD